MRDIIAGVRAITDSLSSNFRMGIFMPFFLFPTLFHSVGLFLQPVYRFRLQWVSPSVIFYKKSPPIEMIGSKVRNKRRNVATLGVNTALHRDVGIPMSATLEIIFADMLPLFSTRCRNRPVGNNPDCVALENMVWPGAT